jgi:hypothetical protein
VDQARSWHYQVHAPDRLAKLVNMMGDGVGDQLKQPLVLGSQLRQVLN